MRKSLFSTAAAAVFLASASFAFAQQATTTTTTTWTNDEGAMIREYSTTKKYSPVTDPSLRVTVGSELPATVKTYPLPDTIKIQDPDRYSYVIVNDQPVVVETTTRRVVHTW